MAGLIDTGISYRKQAGAAMAAAARGENEIANANRKLNAAEKAGKWNAAGQGLGMGYTAYQTGLLGKAATKMGASKPVIDALTPSPPTAPVPTTGPTGQEQMLSQPAPATSTQGGQTVADAMDSGEIPSGTLSSVADAPLPAEAATSAGEAATAGEAAATGGNVTSMGGTLGGAINGAASGFASGMASGGLGTAIGGGIGGGLGGAIGGTIASPLTLAGTAANAVGATGVGTALTGAGEAITAAATTAGSAALEGLASLIMAF